MENKHAQRGKTTTKLGQSALALLSSLSLCAMVQCAERPLSIPFKLYRGYTVVAEGSMGGIDKLHLLIDTGAVPSVVDHRLARRLHLTGRAEQLTVFSRTVPAEGVMLRDVQLGSLRVKSVPVLEQDLSFIEKGLGIRIDALIGLDILGQRDFTIDYANRQITFGPPQSSPDLRVPIEGGLPYATVQVQLDGQPVRLLLDTGAKDLILFAVRARGFLVKARIHGGKTSSNLGGTVFLRQVRVSRVRVGATDLAVHRAFLLETAEDVPPDIDGLFGVVAARPKRVGFDFKHRTVDWSW